MFEKDVTPGGYSGGGPIDTTTMRNTQFRTMAPKSLKTYTPVSATVAYATVALDTILANINVKQLITITYPDNSTVEFYGWIDEFTPGAHTEGEQPTATITIQPSNTDSAGAENEPNYIAPGESS
ncbi:MAG: hypothetical protein Unbinned3891contig1000_87 [Prokaryotic dsDNA virus sp.]|nr:MAG: hypothetical protein Unbinned3891contig1000_87 [Prokaryotic dsDNA virus sp.]